MGEDSGFIPSKASKLGQIAAFAVDKTSILGISASKLGKGKSEQNGDKTSSLEILAFFRTC